MPDIDPVALTALIISVVALTTTVGQLLQQYFATADGYRRCLPSVMGRWGTKTERRWRWSEFRFETIYYVPDISIRRPPTRGFRFLLQPLEPPVPLGEIWTQDWRTMDLRRQFLLGKPEDMGSEDATGATGATGVMGAMGATGTTGGIGEAVCWVAFLKRLSQAQIDIGQTFLEHSSPDELWAKPPTLTLLRRSWDFMPLEAIRPLCRTTISDIAMLVLRLDMTWKEFDPTNGKLRAEGPTALITSRSVRSIGLCLDYIESHSDETGFDLFQVMSRMFLPVDGTSFFLFGILPRNPGLTHQDLPVGTVAEITSYLDLLDRSEPEDQPLVPLLERAMGERDGWLPGFNDLIPLMAPKLSNPNSTLCSLPMPNRFSAGVLRSREGLVAFCERLQAEEDWRASAQLTQIVSWIKELENDRHWKSLDHFWGSISPFLGPDSGAQAMKEHWQRMHDILDGAERLLRTFENLEIDSMASLESRSFSRYDRLVSQHLSMSIRSYAAAMAGLRSVIDRPARWRGLEGGSAKGSRNWLAACMNAYWDGLDGLCEAMEVEVPGLPYQLVREAWITMIFRAFCWHHCHCLVPIEINLPSAWHRSQVPVYLG